MHFHEQLTIAKCPRPRQKERIYATATGSAPFLSSNGYKKLDTQELDKKNDLQDFALVNSSDARKNRRPRTHYNGPNLQTDFPTKYHQSKKYSNSCIKSEIISKLLTKAIPTSTTLGRALLFVATHLCSICLFLMWHKTNNATLLKMIKSILTCDQSRMMHCGVTQQKRWYNINDVSPTQCTDPMQPNVTQFCDADYFVSHFMASFLMCQLLSVIVWAIVWVYAEMTYLNVKNPYSSSQRNNLHGDQDNGDFIKSNRRNKWHQSLSNYYSKCGIRAKEEQSRLLTWRLWNSLTVICQAVINIFAVMLLSMWYWGNNKLDFTVKLLIPALLHVLAQLGSDPNFLAKFFYAWKKNRSFVQSDFSPANKHRATLDMIEAEADTNWSGQVCMLIACHMSASNDFEAAQLRRTLESALVHLPANHIFVCDNADSNVPPDETQSLVASVNPSINYLYIPVGNKSFAFYWTEKYWLPHVQKAGVLPKRATDFILTIDDDVRLPRNFSVPIQRLVSDDDVAAVQYQVVASDFSEHNNKDGKPLLVGLQDIEYMALNQIPESYAPPPKSAFSPGMLLWCPPMYCSGALALWRRKDFREVMSKHDTVFHGEDLQMGILTVAKRTGKRLVACDNRNIVIPTTAPSTIGDLIRQRVKSWDLVAPAWGANFFFAQMIYAFYHGIMLGHKTSMKYIPWFLWKLIALVFLHDPSLFLVRIFVWLFIFPDFRWNNNNVIVLLSFAAITVCLHFLGPIVYYGHSRDFIEKWRLPTLREWLMWPVYLWGSASMTFLAYIYNLTAYGHARLPPSIESREALGDVPPCPTETLPDWKTVWKLGYEENHVLV